VTLDPDVTSYLTLTRGKEITLKQRFYQTGQFARKASVTLRTLRFYDKVGLFSPSHFTESGYRLYSEEDLLVLQQILALKFLGFTLDEIRTCLRRGPNQLGRALERQKRMMQERRRHLDSIIKAIERLEDQAAEGRLDRDALSKVMEVIQMEQNTEWVKKYFTDEQLQTMNELIGSSYSEDALETMAQHPKSWRSGAWTEEDQERASADWAHVASESQRLAAIGADPAGEEAQTLARFKSDLLSQFTQNDPEITAGLKKFWENFNSLPQEKQPFAWSHDPEASAFLDRAMEIYQERQVKGNQ